MPSGEQDREDQELSLRLGFTMSPETARKLLDLREEVRAAGHHMPSQRVLVSALIHWEHRDGKRIEREVLVPFRQSDPSVSRTGD
jgi:hypothetical protein